MRTRTTIGTCLALALSAWTPAVGSDWRASEVVTSYVSGTSPTLILGFDNNLEICLALGESKTREELAASGVRTTRSQIVLLQLWNLLVGDGDGGWKCNLPVIEPPISDEMRTLGSLVAEQILTTARDRIGSYIERVGAAGWPEHRYTMIGSFVLDGLVWEALERLHAIPSADASTIPSGSEYWSGVSWITLPPRPVKVGTNSHSTDGGVLYSAWSAAALDAQADLRREGLREELVALAFGRNSVDPDHSSTLRDLGLLRGGEARIPAIDTTSPLCREGGGLAVSIAEAMLKVSTLQEMLRKTGARDESVAMIMAYHWIYPEVLKGLESDGLEPPSLLTGQPGGQLAPTLFAVAPDTRCVPPID